jgi:hypothetical protein
MLGPGAELWQYRDGKLQLWDAAMIVWEAGADPRRYSCESHTFVPQYRGSGRRRVIRQRVRCLVELM